MAGTAAGSPSVGGRPAPNRAEMKLMNGAIFFLTLLCSSVNSRDPFDNSDLEFVTDGYQAKYYNAPLGNIHPIQQAPSNGFKMGDIEIKGFRISCKSSTYKPGTGACGIIVYDVGTCPRSVCGSMRNGYVIIYDKEKYKNAPSDTNHAMTVYQHFGMSGADLQRKYGMRFGGFSVKAKIGANNLPVMGYGSGTFNIGNAQNQNTGIANLKDGLRGLNAYEASVVYMAISYWVKYGPAKTIWYSDAAKFFKQNSNTIEKSFGRYKLKMISDWKQEFPQA